MKMAVGAPNCKGGPVRRPNFPRRGALTDCKGSRNFHRRINLKCESLSPLGGHKVHKFASGRGTGVPRVNDWAIALWQTQNCLSEKGSFREVGL